MRKCPSLFLISLFFTASAFCQSNDSISLRIDSIFATYHSPDAPGVAVAVIRGDSLVARKCYGMASLEYHLPVTDSTVFDIASVSKQFIALGISMLVEAGRIDPGADIHRYLPWLPDFHHQITVQQMLWHTSGIRDAYEGLAAAGWRWTESFGYADILQFARDERQLNFMPGSNFSYCNTEYALLQSITEQCTGQSFNQWTDSAIFRPLGMKASLFTADYSTIISNLAIPYVQGNHGSERSLQQRSGYTMYSTLRDMCTWSRYVAKRIAAGDPVFMRMIRPGTLNNNEEIAYGWGLMLEEDRGQQVIFHTGAWRGYRAVFKYYPKQNLSIIMLHNGGDPAFNGIYSDRVVDLFIPRPATVIPKYPEEAGFVQPSLQALQRYTGRFKWGGAEVVFSIENGQLMFQYTGEIKYAMRALNDSVFLLVAPGFPLTFKKNKKGQINSFLFRSKTGERFNPANPSLNEMREYTGMYYSEELKTTYEIFIHQNRLRLRQQRRGEFSLSPDERNIFLSELGKIEFTRNRKAKVTQLLLSGDNIRNIRFEKRPCRL